VESVIPNMGPTISMMNRNEIYPVNAMVIPVRNQSVIFIKVCCVFPGMYRIPLILRPENYNLNFNYTIIIYCFTITIFSFTIYYAKISSLIFIKYFFAASKVFSISPSKIASSIASFNSPTFRPSVNPQIVIISSPRTGD